jgi:hypothetical protein
VCYHRFNHLQVAAPGIYPKGKAPWRISMGPPAHEPSQEPEHPAGADSAVATSWRAQPYRDVVPVDRVQTK